jgi:hypothetical protein
MRKQQVQTADEAFCIITCTVLESQGRSHSAKQATGSVECLLQGAEYPVTMNEVF